MLIGNLLLRNPTVSGSSIPTIEINIPTVPAGRTDGGTLPEPTITIRGLPNTSDVRITVQDLRRIVPELASGRIVIPSTLGHPIILKGTDIPGLLATIQNQTAPEVLMGGLQTEAPVAVLTMASQSVFTQGSVHQPAGTAFAQPSLRGADQPQGHTAAAALFSAGEIVYSTANGSHAQPQAAASAFPAGQTVRATVAESARIPEAAKQVLTAMGLLPPGIGTEEALPRLQEVLRLWTTGNLPADMAAHVEKMVNQVLTSAVLSTALQGQLPAANARDGQSPEAAKGAFGSFGTAVFSQDGRADNRSGPLTRNQIADAVLNALTGMTSLPSTSALPGRAASTMPAGEGSPTANPQNTGNLPAGTRTVVADKQGSPSRADSVRADGTLARTDVIDRSTREAKQTRLNGDEHHERMETAADELDARRAAHDQESQGHPDEADTHAVEALWNQLHTDLQRAGFVAASGSLRPLEFSEEGREVLALIAARVPDGWDLIDALNLVDARMSLSPEAGAVNSALHRIANYRKTWKNDKVRALLEPLHDAFVQLGLVADDIVSAESSDISLEDLKGFQTHLAAVQMILDRPKWMERIGDAEDRTEIANVLPDVEELLERVAERLPRAQGPAYFQAPAQSLPH